MSNATQPQLQLTTVQALQILKSVAAHKTLLLCLDDHSAVQQALAVFESLVNPPAPALTTVPKADTI